MASKTVVKVNVQELSKYGFKANDRYVGWSKNFKEADKAQVVPGRTFEMEFYIADSGKEYCNKILKQLDAPTAPPLVAPVFAKTPLAKEVSALRVAKPNTAETMTRADWDSKDLRISRQGVIQAAVQAVSHMGTALDIDMLFTNAESLADMMLSFVNQK